MNARYKSTEIYGNWKMLSPEGELMSRCDLKRATWYLDRDLATLVGDKEIQLKFKPRGNGNAGIEYLMEEKENRCVVCGSFHELNRHHVVPYQYRKWFPLKHKSKSSYDIVSICIPDHEKYEDLAQEYTRELAIKYASPLNYTVPLDEDAKQLKRVLGFARLITNHSSTLPTKRLEEIKIEMFQYFGEKTLEEILQIEVPKKLSNPISHGELVVRAVLEQNSLQEFIEGWREHFLMSMQPQFLSKNWDVKHVHVANLHK